LETVKILKKLVSFNTAEDLENNEAIVWIENYLIEKGFSVSRVFDKNTKKANLVAQIGKKPILAFSGHLDTVKATQGWDSNPLKLTIENNIAYGLGVCDMKGRNSCFFEGNQLYRYW